MGDGRSDAELVAAALHGDQEAFGELMSRHEGAVCSVAGRELGDLEAARDAAQDTFVKAYLNLSSLRSPDSFGYWVCSIAKGTARDTRRRRRREVALEAADSLVAELPTESEMAGQVRRALDCLPDLARRAVTLHYLDGCSHAEIARLLHLTPGAVKVRLSRARARLRKEMAAMVGEELEQTVLVFGAKVKPPDDHGGCNIGVGGQDSPLLRLHMALLAYDEACCLLKPSVPPPWAEERREGIAGHLAVVIADGFRYGASGIRIVTKEKLPPEEHELRVTYDVPGGAQSSWSGSGGVSARYLIDALAERAEVPPSVALQGTPTHALVHVGSATWRLPVTLAPTEAKIDLSKAGVSQEAAEAALSERVAPRCRDMVRAALTQTLHDGAVELRAALSKRDSITKIESLVGEDWRRVIELSAQLKIHASRPSGSGPPVEQPHKPGAPIEHPLWQPLREAFAELAGVTLREGAARQTGRFEFVVEGVGQGLRVVVTPKMVKVTAG